VILVILALPIVLIAGVAAAFTLANRTNGELVSSGEKRTYLLYVPESYDPATPAPLVIAIHGFSEWPAHQMEISNWNALADRYGFIVVYPSGTGFPLRWRTTDTPDSDNDPARDVTFISDLIDWLSADYNVDSSRIYVNGLSNGGGMSFVLACRLSERIAAFGSVAGAYLLPWDACRPSRPVPAIVFHGTADPIVPFEGGSSGWSNMPFPAISDWVAALARLNGCAGEPSALPARGDVSGVRYSGCAADVVFYTVAGGGHSWPGGTGLPESIVGYTSQDIDATQVMWDFFQAHPLARR
jgi:polyhydroxybutyrate depolymerase